MRHAVSGFVGLATLVTTLTGCAPPRVVTAKPPTPTPTLSPPPLREGLDGTYSGTGSLRGNMLGTCRTTIEVGGFTVTGNRVVWGQFRGAMQANATLQLVNGRRFLRGRFRGPHFDGEVTANQPGTCNYTLSLDRDE